MKTVKEQIAEEIHAQARKKFPRRIVTPYAKDNMWQADLVDMRKYCNKNKNFTFII